MRISVTGSSGLIGSALVPFLTAEGHEVGRVVRSTTAAGAWRWDPGAGHVDAGAVNGKDAVVHLAGETIAAGRWSAARKARIRDSRVRGTRVVAQAVARADPRPKALLCASAMGFYGDRGDERLTEASAPGRGFLCEVSREWEEACAPARDQGVRVVNLRFGIVLSPAGGALAKMLLPFRLGAGGVVGSGKQWWSWVALDDAVGAIQHALVTAGLSGPLNVAAPNPVTNAEFTRTLGRVLARPTLFPVPVFAARLAFGEMADALLLASARVVPERLQQTGYVFRHPELEGALRHLLGR
ncbi:MAG: TIGR01777 family protein [Acidobacteria bacterium RBG_16_70_10]|nr:MAG: TIGR01777 family protein [Acidobacteria bacterium RBG_16_70_10]